MKPGDRVTHKKFGLGTVRAVYAKTNAARVLYDSGHETTNAQKKLTVLTAGQGGAPKVEEQVVVTATQKRRKSNSSIDYDLIDEACRVIGDMHPDAERIQGKWYGHRAYVEVWKEGRAHIVFYDPGL